MKKHNLSKYFVLALSIFSIGSLTACGTVRNTPGTTTNPSTTNPTVSTTGTDTSYNRSTANSSRNFNSTTTAEDFNSVNNYTGTYNTTNIGTTNSRITTDGFTNSSYMQGTLSKYSNMTNNIPTYSPGSDVVVDFKFNNYNSTVNNATANTAKNLNNNTAGSYKNLKIYVYKDSAVDNNLVDTHNVKDFKGGKIDTGRDMSHKYTFKAPKEAGSYVYKAVVARDGIDEVYYDHFNVK